MLQVVLKRSLSFYKHDHYELAILCMHIFILNFGLRHMLFFFIAEFCCLMEVFTCAGEDHSVIKFGSQGLYLGWLMPSSIVQNGGER